MGPQVANVESFAHRFYKDIWGHMQMNLVIVHRMIGEPYGA